MQKIAVLLLAILSLCTTSAPAQKSASWRAAKPEELEAVLPARAPVEKEHIETEMRTATGIVNDHGKMVAAVVLITAGYAADGKYSHYLLVQSRLTVADRSLPPGAYVVGWKHSDDGLLVRIFDAVSGAEKATVVAKPMTNPRRVESFRIWSPEERSIIQIGRYSLPYSVDD